MAQGDRQFHYDSTLPQPFERHDQHVRQRHSRAPGRRRIKPSPWKAGCVPAARPKAVSPSFTSTTARPSPPFRWWPTASWTTTMTRSPSCPPAAPYASKARWPSPRARARIGRCRRRVSRSSGGWTIPKAYPIAKKRHTFEYLRTVAHLRPRTNTIGAVARVRHALSQAVHRYFDEHGFFWVHTPIITANDCEGAGDLFRVSTLDQVNLDPAAPRPSPSPTTFSAPRRSSRCRVSSIWRATVWLFPRSIPSRPPSVRKTPTPVATWPSSG